MRLRLRDRGRARRYAFAPSDDAFALSVCELGRQFARECRPQLEKQPLNWGRIQRRAAPCAVYFSEFKYIQRAAVSSDVAENRGIWLWSLLPESSTPVVTARTNFASS